MTPAYALFAREWGYLMCCYRHTATTSTFVRPTTLPHCDYVTTVLYLTVSVPLTIPKPSTFMWAKGPGGTVGRLANTCGVDVESPDVACAHYQRPADSLGNPLLLVQLGDMQM